MLRKLRLALNEFTNANITKQKFDEVEKALATIPDSLAENLVTISPPTRVDPFSPYPIPSIPAELQATCETINVITTPTVNTDVISKRPDDRPNITTPTETTGAIPKRRRPPIAKRRQRDKNQGEDLKVTAATNLGLLKQTEKIKGDKITKKSDDIEMAAMTHVKQPSTSQAEAALTPVEQPSIEAILPQNDDKMVDIDLSEPENTENRSEVNENTFVIFRMIENRRFKKLFKK